MYDMQHAGNAGTNMRVICVTSALEHDDLHKHVCTYKRSARGRLVIICRQARSLVVDPQVGYSCLKAPAHPCHPPIHPGPQVADTLDDSVQQRGDSGCGSNRQDQAGLLHSCRLFAADLRWPPRQLAGKLCLVSFCTCACPCRDYWTATVLAHAVC